MNSRKGMEAAPGDVVTLALNTSIDDVYTILLERGPMIAVVVDGLH